ncbi:MAG: hypothetical protein K5636_01085 [Bacteroidales bacterium]|nr:hypothetical protein [Bacteroidales bacterium]
MKKFVILLTILAVGLVASAQTAPMKFLGINMNCTMNTFVNKLKGKGFVQDVNTSHDNTVFMKGAFAGERVKLEIRAAAKTHLVYIVVVNFNRSTSYTYSALKTKLTEKYGGDFQELNGLDELDKYAKFTTDYSVWQLNADTTTNVCNRLVLSQCSYRANFPLVLSYIDGRNAIIDLKEIDSDF